MKNYPTYFENEVQLEEALSRPSLKLIELIKSLEGDILFLGVAGKMGVSMARMAKRACDEAGIQKRIIGVARFSAKEQQLYLEKSGVETIKGDLLDQDFLKSLPEVKNVFYLAGMKFGTENNEPFTWAMNSYLPGLIVEKFKSSKIVAFSTGCVYPLVTVASGGSKEIDPVGPIGEYAQSCLGRERLFQYGSLRNKTEIILIRLNYAVEMRYGVLVDIAKKVYKQETIDVTMGYANVIWQGDANDMILRSIQLTQSPATKLNISGAQTISVSRIAKKIGEFMNKNVTLSGREADSALLVNVSRGHEFLGKPNIELDQLVKWTADWVSKDKPTLGKPTHFEVRDGKY